MPCAAVTPVSAIGYGQDFGKATADGVAAAVESGPRSVFEQPIAVVHTIMKIQAAVQRMKALSKGRSRGRAASPILSRDQSIAARGSCLHEYAASQRR